MTPPRPGTAPAITRGGAPDPGKTSTPSGGEPGTGESPPMPPAREGAKPGRFLRRGRWLADGVPVLLLLLWWWLAHSGRVAAYILPHPALVLAKTLGLFTDPVLRVHTLASVSRVIIALAAALAAGAALALTAYLIPALRVLINERVAPFLNAVPTLGWAMLGILWFGPGDGGVVFVQAAIILPFVFINLWEGLQDLDPALLEMAHSFSRHRGRVITKVALPLMGPYILAALRLSYGVSWKVSLVAEIFGTNRGLGYLLAWARSYVDSVLLLAVILVVIIFVFAGDRLIFGPAAQRQAAWREQQP